MISPEAKMAFITSMGWDVMCLGENRFKVEDVAEGEVFLYGGVDVLDKAINILTCNFRINR